MSTQRVAHRYASALLALTGEQKKPDAVAADLRTVLNAVDASRELRSLLSSPVIGTEKKRAVVRDLFKKKVGDMTLLYMDSIVLKGRESLLHDILKRYFVLRDEQLGIARVTVTAAAELSAKQEKELQKQLEAMTGKSVELTVTVDPAVKGGFVARVGDTVLDASVKRQLELLKQRLTQGTFTN